MALCLGATLAHAPAEAREAPFPKAKPASFHSAALGERRKVQVWLPPGYAAKPEARYPVIYVLHGLGGSERDFFQLGKLESHLKRALATGVTPPAIVISPDGDDGYWTDHAPSGAVAGPRWGAYVADDLIAWVDARYRTLADREHRAIVGVSMGGYGALSLALSHPDRFGAAVSLSGALFPTLPTHRPVYRRVWGDPPNAAWFARASPMELLRTLPLDAPMPAVYLHVGDSDELGFVAFADAAHKVLMERGIDHTYRVTPGGHSWSVWAAETPAWLAFVGAWLARPPPKPARPPEPSQPEIR
ncbi:MAG: alpha/beta hydrolase-fold protein [Myxococcota bacterium]